MAKIMIEPRLIYILDPMCSWCYAFSESLHGLQRDLPPRIGFYYLLGGLAPDTTTPMPIEMQQAIQQTWRRIETTVPGVQFNFDFWTLTMPVRSTYPACRALLAARQQGLECETLLLRAIQSAYYQQARNPSLLDVLEQCAAEIGLDTAEFGHALRSPAIELALQHDIQTSRNMGVSVYPSLRLLHDGQQSVITVDYFKHQPMLDQIAGFLNPSIFYPSH